MKIENIFRHLHLINKHKWFVFKRCCKAGILLQGFTHDLSKYSPVEFWESIKYYDGTKSPISKCKEEKGWSAAWQHHKGCNKHHYQYWIDTPGPDGTFNFIKMPYKYALELICDYLGAAQAYLGDKFSYEAEYEWWTNENKKFPLAMHPDTYSFINTMLFTMKMSNSDDCLQRNKSLQIYNSIS